VPDLLARIAPLANPTNLTLTPVDCSRPSGARMKGFALLHLLDLMTQKHGGDAAPTWRGSLPDSVQREVEPRALTSVGWLPVEYYFGAVTWVTNQFYGGDVRAASELGHAVTQRDIGAFFRKAMSFASPTTVLSLSGRFWRGYFDQSKFTVRSSTKHAVVAEVSDWPLRDAASAYELAGSFACWMDATSARDVRIARLELTAPGTLQFEANWS
jgi:hypothetical protein